jgi:hypothetical protein
VDVAINGLPSGLYLDVTVKKKQVNESFAKSYASCEKSFCSIESKGRIEQLFWICE